jgi:hypothetical protein
VFLISRLQEISFITGEYLWNCEPMRGVNLTLLNVDALINSIGEGKIG